MRPPAVLLLFAVVACTPSEPPERKARVEGPHIVSTKAISETETVRVLVIPHPLGEFFDTNCVIYTHQEFRLATMSCPNADSSNLRDSTAEH